MVYFAGGDVPYVSGRQRRIESQLFTGIEISSFIDEQGYSCIKSQEAIRPIFRAG